jgi:DNA repair protein RecO (recombination protein O)
MNREQKLTAIILKKQPFKEGDEIITFFTKEQGKVRAIAKSIKLSKSKLQQKLQNLFLVGLTLSAGNLPKIISVEPVEVFLHMRENLSRVKIAYYALELVLKFTPDEQKNEKLFNLFLEFLRFLDTESAGEKLEAGLAIFKIGILTTAGLSISAASYRPAETVYFSPSLGGFFYSKARDSLQVYPKTYQDYLILEKADFAGLKNFENAGNMGQLQSLLSLFIEYQLERKVNSEKYLNEQM